MSYKNYRLVPFLVLLYFFFHFILDYFYFVQPEVVAGSFIKYLVTVTVLYFFGLQLFKNKEKFTLIFTSILFVFLFFGSILDTLNSYNLFKPSSAVFLKYCLAFLAVSGILAIIFALCRQHIIQKFLKAWFIYCVAVMAYDAVTFIFRDKPEKKYLQIRTDINLKHAPSKPHVFFILFDMYSSDSIYRRYYSYNNSAIHDSLAGKGFYKTHNGKSLYDLTHLCLSSTLNLELLNYPADSSLPEAKKALLSVMRTENSALLSAFIDAGYKLNNYSFFNLNGHRSPLSFNLEDHAAYLITGTTIYNRVYNGVDVDMVLMNRNIDLTFWKNSWSEDTKNDIDFLSKEFGKTLTTIKSASTPTFNYFHFMIPHPPIIYDSAGKQLPLRDMYSVTGFEKSIAKYVGFTKYGNRKIMDMVNQIFAEIGDDAVIIVQGDHGYREFDARLPDEVKYGVFNSVYLPNKNYAGFHDSLTTLETFKLVLQNQFSTIVK